MKRMEISTRSWFSPSASGRTSEALRKLALGGRTLRGPPTATPAGLGIVRRRSGEGPEGPAEPGGPERDETTPRSPPGPQGDAEAGTAPRVPPNTATSLVADYSDSSSEAESP